jgi:hypothetical protein
MCQASEIKNGNIYETSRLKAKMSRREAIEHIGYSQEKTLQRIESGEARAHPENVVSMARAYKDPGLIFEHCKHECPIGQLYHHHLEKMNFLAAVTQLYLAAKGIDETIHLLLEIGKDEQITPDEITDLEASLTKLNQIEHGLLAVKLSCSDVIPIDRLMDKRKNSPPPSKSCL